MNYLNAKIIGSAQGAVDLKRRLDHIEEARSSKEFKLAERYIKCAGLDAILAKGEYLRLSAVNDALTGANIDPVARIAVKRALERTGLLI